MADHPVYLTCPACQAVWLSAILREGAWWAQGLTPEKVAQKPCCPFCSCSPPMNVYEPLPLLQESA